MALKHLLAGAALIGLMAQPALAQSQDTTQQQPAQAGQQQLAQEDMEFATKAAQGGLKEVQLGQLAQQQATRDEVKQFGQRMVEDHGQANEQLMQIAQDKGIELPQELADEDQQKYDELQQKSGEEFDQAYMDEMVRDHEEDVEEFQQYVETGQDPDLTGFAEQTLPVLEEHLQLAQQTQEQVTAAAGQGEQPAAAAGEQQATTATEQQATAETEQPAAAAGGTQPEPTVATEIGQPATDTEHQAVTETEQPAATDTEQQAVTETEQPAAAAGGTQPEPRVATEQQAATETEQPAATETEQAATETEQPAATETGQQAATEPQQPISIEEVLGSRVVNQAGEEVATIDDLVIDQSGQQYAVLSVGGFLGIGDKKVAVPLDELQLSEDEVYLMTAATEEQLEQMPEYDEEQFQPYAQQ
jgi:putative membrane protein